MSSFHKRPASPRHCTLYVPAAKRPRLAVNKAEFDEIRPKKRKYSEEFCESCLNNQRAGRTYYNKDILHNAACQSGEIADPGRVRCRNFQNGSADSEDSLVINPESACLGDARARKKPRIYPSDNMQIIYKDLTQPKSAIDEDKADLDPKFNSFNFWKPVLPDIDSQLFSILEDRMDSEPSPSLKEEENPEFNSFNYWRLPLQDIDVDLDLDTV